jgi:hypothetical protein
MSISQTGCRNTFGVAGCHIKTLQKKLLWAKVMNNDSHWRGCGLKPFLDVPRIECPTRF